MHLKKLLFPAVFVASFALLALGLATSDVTHNLWMPWLARQASCIALASFGATAAGFWLIRKSVKHAHFCLLAILAAALCAIFGPLGFLGGILVALCCFITGHAILLAAGSIALPAVDVFATGLAAIILLLTGASVAHINMPILFWVIAVSCSASIALPKMRARFFADLMSLQDFDRPAWSSLPILTLIIFGLSFFAANAALPDAAWDALVMHLLIPTQILLHGLWSFDPVLYAFAFFPLGTDYIYTFAMNFGDEMGAKFLNLLIYFAITLQLYSLTRRLFDAAIARYAVLLFLAIPIGLVVTASLFVENTLCLLALTAARLLVLQETRKDRGVLIALIIVYGAMTAVKLHGLFVAAPVMVIALLNQKNAVISRKDWQWLAASAAICAVLGLLPYIYAWVVTGNPVFMFKNSLFHSPYWSETDMVDTRWIGKLSPTLLYNMTFKSGNYLEASSGAMGFAFMALLPAGLIACWFAPRKALTVCAAVSLTYLTLVVVQMQYIRYLYPVFPLLIVVCMAGLARLRDLSSLRPAIPVLATALALLGIYKLPAGAWAQQTANLAGIYDDGIRTQLTLAQAPARLANTFINGIAVTPPRVIYAAAPFGAFLQGTPIYTDWYNHLLHEALEAAQTMEEVQAAVDAQNADFIIAEPSSRSVFHRKVAQYAQGRFVPIASFGSLIVYRVHP